MADVGNGFGSVGAFFGHHSGDFRDDFSTFFNEHHIALVEVEALDLVGIVQGSSLDGSACQQHRCKVGYWGDGTSTPHLVGDGKQGCFSTFCFVFVGNCPAGIFGGKAKLFPLLVVVELDYYPIGI